MDEVRFGNIVRVLSLMAVLAVFAFEWVGGFLTEPCPITSIHEDLAGCAAEVTCPDGPHTLRLAKVKDVQRVAGTRRTHHDCPEVGDHALTSPLWPDLGPLSSSVRGRSLSGYYRMTMLALVLAAITWVPLGLLNPPARD